MSHRTRRAWPQPREEERGERVSGTRPHLRTRRARRARFQRAATHGLHACAGPLARTARCRTRPGTLRFPVEGSAGKGIDDGGKGIDATDLIRLAAAKAFADALTDQEAAGEIGKSVDAAVTRLNGALPKGFGTLSADLVSQPPDPYSS